MKHTRIAGLLLLFLAILACAQQSPGRAVLVSLADPIYPPLARQANISGDVIVEITVRPGGQSDAALVNGHPMLKQAAIDSAMHSTFECPGCTESAKYWLVYSFQQTEEGDCCTALSVPARVKREPRTIDQLGRPKTHVTVAAVHGCLCDPTTVVSEVRVRAAKCFYLWHCSKKLP